MSFAKVIDIYISKKQGSPCLKLEQVKAIARMGLEGDRYCICEKSQQDANVNAVTLQSIEAISACNKELKTTFLPADFRRNIITQGIDLNTLVGKTFRVGEVILEGYELCHPCKYLENLLNKDVIKGLCNRGGLRAKILTSGILKIGSQIHANLEEATI